MSDVAVLHGNYFARGGGERVADSIAEAFDAPLYYGFGNADAIPNDDLERVKLFHPTRLGKMLVENVHQYRDFRFMWNGMHIPELFDYDAIIQSGNEFGWFVPKQMDQAVVKYVHSPPRGPYDMHYKHGSSRMHRLYSLLAKTLYGHTTDYVDVYVANSETVAQRCRKAWGVNPRIVYPPVDTSQYGLAASQENREGVFLTFSRLYRHKRTREVVEAFASIDANLIVGGDGPQRKRLQEIATSNIDVRGYLPEAEKRRLLAECEALIFNAENEDFGLVPVEAFASGTPVIGIRDGFTKHQIQDGKNGILYDGGGDPAKIRAAVAEFMRDGVSWTPERIADFAAQFNRERFEVEMAQAIEDARKRCEQTPKCGLEATDDR